MKKYLISIAIILLIATATHAEPSRRGTSEALHPLGTSTQTLFDNVTSLGPGSDFDTKFLPNEVTWEVVPFGTITSLGFEVTIDASIRRGTTAGTCAAGSYYPISTMTEATIIRFRGVDFTGYKCIRPNYRQKVGSGGMSVYAISRGN